MNIFTKVINDNFVGVYTVVIDYNINQVFTIVGDNITVNKFNRDALVDEILENKFEGNINDFIIEILQDEDLKLKYMK